LSAIIQQGIEVKQQDAPAPAPALSTGCHHGSTTAGTMAYFSDYRKQLLLVLKSYTGPNRQI